MSKETQKQCKLAQVSNELTQIKKQLHQLMHPLPEKVDHGAMVKLDWGAIRKKIEMQKGDRKKVEKGTVEKKTVQDCDIKGQDIGDCLKCVHTLALRSPREGINLDQKGSLLVRKKSEEGTVLKNQGLKEIKSQLKFKGDHKHMPKLQFFPSCKVKQNHSSERKRPAQIKKFNHVRHYTQYDMPTSPKLQVPRHKLHTEQGGISLQSLREKKPLASNRRNPELNSRKLRRVRSDFRGNKNMNDQTILKESGRTGRVLELEEELKKKDQVIAFLTSEVQEIERSFKTLEGNLKNILSRHSKFQGKLTDLEVNQALRVVMNQIQTERSEIQKYQRECQRLRLVKEEQEAVISVLEEKFMEVQRIVTDPEPEKVYFLGQLKTLSAKLQLAVSENKMKDEFIVSILTLKNKSLSRPSENLEQLLGKYLSQCEYPCNRLLEKLTEEETQIKKLKQRLEKTQ